jgi:hypothetical protein
MHRNITTAASVAPTSRFTSEKHANAPRRAIWNCLGFVGVMCALVGCATAPSPRGPADIEGREQGEPRASTGLVSAAPRASTGVNGAESSDDAAAMARLPWLSPSHVGAAVRAHRDDFQACQALGDVLSQREDGAVTVGWAVRANGSVNRVTLGPSTFQSASINSCVLGVARQVKFPRSASPAEVSWTVQFRGASHGPLADATLR